MMIVHLHKGSGSCDRAECGAHIDCSNRAETAYRSLDPERVTCAECKRLA